MPKLPEIMWRDLGNGRVEIIDRRSGKPRRSTISKTHLVTLPPGIVKVRVVPRAMMQGIKTTSLAPTLDAPIRRVTNAKPRKVRPGLLKRGVNFAKAAARHVATGGRQASQQAIQERFAICEKCDSYQKQDENSGFCREQTCGCNIANDIRFPNKLAWAEQRCPLSRWGPCDG